ncbi:endogenous retrovirus group K member 10 Gag polyprotein-like [Zalophus californianus]|uniref:Endogenous retrovirus group K member 10 Gag polyprotein-like n=1 Tax=Zalophus californianus TaxID=9704 RepID=A0A6P9FFD8_ZALCA|nr:endogenous retrovirus group K member 10 Gag polyprotein-like [Zalophus californianus]
MGQSQSASHAYFLRTLRVLLAERGHKVSSSTLQEFFRNIEDLCPWFPPEGTANPEDWRRVGQEMKNQIKLRGSGALPPNTMGLWSHICEILEPQQKIELISLKSWVEDEEKDPIKVPLTPTGVSSFEILGNDANLPAQDPFPPPPPPMPLAGKAPRAQSGGDEFGDDDVYLDDDPILTMPTSLKSVLPAVTTSGQGINSMTKCTQTSTLQAFPIMTNQQSAAKSSVSNISPLQRTLLTAQQAGEDVGEFNAYPVTLQGGQRTYTALNFKMLKDLKAACSQYGATAPFTLSMMENLTREALCPGDWKVVARACLNGGDYLLWKAEFEEKCNNLAIYNRRTQIPVTYEMLAGTGAYYEVGNQIHFPEIAYAQINEAVLTAWKKLPTTGTRTEELSKIRQGPDERYQDFVSRLLQAVSRIVVDGEAGTIIVKQLAFENANSACQAAIRPWKSTGTLEEFLRLCADIGPSYVQGVTLAAALREIPPQQLHSQLLKKQKGKSGPTTT